MKTLCALQNLTLALEQYEKEFQNAHGLSLKEGMLLCCISEQQLTASDIATKIDLTNSNCSKVIKSAEHKGLIERSFGKEDKRNMFFVLTEDGKVKLIEINLDQVPIPDALKHFIDSCN